MFAHWVMSLEVQVNPESLETDEMDSCMEFARDEIQEAEVFFRDFKEDSR